MSGYCDHDGEACECGMEIITPLRARLAAAERVVEAARALLDVRVAVSGLLWEEASGRMYPLWEALRAALALPVEPAPEPAPRCEWCGHDSDLHYGPGSECNYGVSDAKGETVYCACQGTGRGA